MVKIRLRRMGSIKRPYYRIVVADSRCSRDGRFIDQIGVYHPLSKDDEKLRFDKEKLKKWFFDGAQPTPIVRKLMNSQNFRFDRKILSEEK